MLVTIDIAKEQILAGKLLLIAGDKALLSKLPKGSWIGGSTPYFIAEAGGVFTEEKVFITELDRKLFSQPVATVYSEESISQIAKVADEDSLTFLILPFGSKVHYAYGINAPGYEDMYLKPITGWVSGVVLDQLGKTNATVVNGFTGEVFTDKAVALRCNTPKDRPAKIGIVNIFKQGSGDSIEFINDGFEIGDVLVNGEKVNFSRYLTNAKIDLRLPLIGNFSGALINISVLANDEANGIVKLAAPALKNMVYKVAASVGNYPEAFKSALKEVETKPIAFSFNCLFNYLYGELEGKKTGNAMGPVTYGEIAYQLVNQTLVYVEI